MSSQKATNVIPKLHAVTLIRSGIGRPYWQKRTLQALNLTKLHKTVIHKNIPSVNGMLASVKGLIKVQPIVFRTDIENSPNRREFLQDNGQFFINAEDWPLDLVFTNRPVTHHIETSSQNENCS